MADADGRDDVALAARVAGAVREGDLVVALARPQHVQVLREQNSGIRHGTDTGGDPRGIPEWFGVEGTLNPIRSHPHPTGRDIPTIPAWPRTLQGWGNPGILWITQQLQSLFPAAFPGEPRAAHHDHLPLLTELLQLVGFLLGFDVAFLDVIDGLERGGKTGKNREKSGNLGLEEEPPPASPSGL